MRVSLFLHAPGFFESASVRSRVALWEPAKRRTRRGMGGDSKYLPIEERLRAFERFPEVSRIVIGPLKRKRWMKHRDGYLRIRRALAGGYVIVAYSFEGRRDAIIRCASEHMPRVRDLIEAVSCGEARAERPLSPAA